jgi:hypothetical protein
MPANRLTMKKISLITLGVCLTVGSFAQEPAKVGIKAGANISSFKQADRDFDSRVGVHVGLFGHVHVAPQWAVQPEIQYSQEGAKRSVTGGEVTTKLDYINIPVMLQYMFNNGFRIEAGPQLGLAVNSKYEDDDGIEADAGNEFKSTNVSLGFGLNYLSYSGIGLGGRYNLGLSDVSESDLTKTKANTFQISLFYLFDHSHKAKSR